MYKYQDFVLESKLDRLEFLSQNLNEGFGSFYDEVQKFLDKEYEIDSDRFEQTVKRLLEKFKGKTKILAVVAGLLLAYMSKDKLHTLMSQSGIPHQEQVEIEKEGKHVEHQIKPHHKTHQEKIPNEIKKFLGALAGSESSGDPKIINDLGYIGKYQFGKSALKDLGLDKKITTQKFRKNPAIFPEHAQDNAMLKLLKLNKEYLGDYIKKFNGQVINGVKITKSGLLAGSHLVGAGAVKEFLDSGGKVVPRDGNNVPVTDYIKKFGKFQIDI